MKGEANQSSLLPSSSTVCSADKPIAIVEDAGPVALLQKLELHRLPLQRQIERAHHDGRRDHVDEEDGAPAIILGEIAADGRPDRRREGDGQREDRKPRPAACGFGSLVRTSVNAIGISTPPASPAIRASRSSRAGRG